VTHPHHPLTGRELGLVERRRGAGGDRAYFYGDHGRLESVPVRWTDLVGPDPAVFVAAGRAYFRVDDLLGLTELIEHLAQLVSGDDGAV